MPRVGDKRISSLQCFGRVIIDNNCNLAAPSACFDSGLKVDIGGNVTMQATTVNFKNATIDFDGATLENFTGNISGNLSGNLNVDVVNALIVNSDKINGNVCGNITADFLVGGLYTGCVCGDITTASITEKVTDAGITVTGNLLGDVVGTHIGPVVGSVCGDITTDSIVSKTGTISIAGETLHTGNMDVDGNVMLSNMNNFFVGNVCGDIYSGMINPKTPGGNVEVTGNLVIGNSIGGNFFGNFFGNLIGNIFPLSTVGDFAGTFTGNMFGKLSGNVCGNVVGGNITGNILTSNVLVSSNIVTTNICANTLQVDCIENKNASLIIVKDSVLFNKNLSVASNIFTANLEVTNGFKFPSGALLEADLCGNITTASISEKVAGGNIGIVGNVGFNGLVTSAVSFVGNLIGSTTGKHTGNVCGNIEPSVGSLVFVNGSLSLLGLESIYINDVQVVSDQQTAVSDASVATAVSLTDSTGGTANQTVIDVSSSVGTVTGYTATGVGAITVTSAAGNDLDITQSGLATLTSEVNTKLGLIDTRLDGINDNFADVTDEINKIITDVGDIRTQLNLLLVAVRAHGLIVT